MSKKKHFLILPLMQTEYYDDKNEENLKTQERVLWIEQKNVSSTYLLYIRGLDIAKTSFKPFNLEIWKTNISKGLSLLRELSTVLFLVTGIMLYLFTSPLCGLGYIWSTSHWIKHRIKRTPGIYLLEQHIYR